MSEVDGGTLTTGANQSVYVIGAAKTASNLDPSIFRSGRFAKTVSCPFPTAEVRK
jgi:ATP-dependent 26S proteasome regulatory subunit